MQTLRETIQSAHESDSIEAANIDQLSKTLGVLLCRNDQFCSDKDDPSDLFLGNLIPRANFFVL